MTDLKIADLETPALLGSDTRGNRGRAAGCGRRRADRHRGLILLRRCHASTIICAQPDAAELESMYADLSLRGWRLQGTAWTSWTGRRI